MSNHATNWDKANNESKIVNESLTTKLERYKERVKNLKPRFNVDLSSHEKFMDSQMDDMMQMKNTKFVAFETKIDTLKHTLSKHVKENESLLTTLNGFKTKFKQREFKSINKDIVLENKNKELENTVSKWIKPTLYDGNVLFETHDVISVVDDEETLILAEDSRLKMLEKQNDPIMKKEKINISPINYSELNKLSEDFGKRFVSQQELSAEQMFWLQSSNKNSEEPSTSNTPVKIEVPSELPKFDKCLHDEITEVQTVFNQMEAAVEQYIVNIVVNSSVVICDSEKMNDDSVDICNKCLELAAEFVKKKDVYIELSKRKLKGKNVINTAVSKPNATIIASGMEHVDTLQEIAENARALSPLDSNLDSAFGNRCPLTRFTSTKVVPLKETTIKSVLRPTPGIKVYSRRSKATKSVGYGDYQIGNVTISSVYYVEGLGHNLFSIGQFCDSDLEVAFLFGQAEAKADVGIFIRYAPAKKAYQIYNRCTTQIMEIIHVDFDELTAMAYEQSSSGPALQEMTHRTLSLRLVPNPSSPTPFVIPTRNDRDTLFQPLFDEYFNLPPSVDYPVPEVAVPEPAVSTGTPSLTSVD
ncbi:hypothetical protein Tco_0838481 [Tanacetum coccineum]|uniref:Retroviral polymerase SH3-like domain-containing protein n=1 Tax=Tanacetum coccineum TaxID=301880 RepID=A0ABQ5ASE9_9ASTR